MLQRISVCVNGTSKVQKELYRKKIVKRVSVSSDKCIENPLRRSWEQIKELEIVYLFDDPNRKFPWGGNREKYNLIINLIDMTPDDTSENHKIPPPHFDHIFFKHPKLVIKYNSSEEGTLLNELVFQSQNEWFQPLIIEDCIKLSGTDYHSKFISDLTEIIVDNYFTLLKQSKEWNDEYERCVRERHLERERLAEQEALKKIPVNLTIMVKDKIINLKITALTTIKEIEEIIEGELKLYVNGIEVRMDPNDCLAVVYKTIIGNDTTLKIPLFLVSRPDVA